MKKDRSNQSSSSKRSRGLSKSDILRGRTNFQRLFDNQEAVIFFDAHIKLRFYTLADQQADYKMGFIVPKKLGNAVQRNRVKRLLKEAYRLHQHSLKDVVSLAAVSFHGALMAKTVAIDFNTAETEVVRLKNKVQAYMHSTFEL